MLLTICGFLYEYNAQCLSQFPSLRDTLPFTWVYCRFQFNSCHLIPYKICSLLQTVGQLHWLSKTLHICPYCSSSSTHVKHRRPAHTACSIVCICLFLPSSSITYPDFAQIKYMRVTSCTLVHALVYLSFTISCLSYFVIYINFTSDRFCVRNDGENSANLLSSGTPSMLITYNTNCISPALRYSMKMGLNHAATLL